MMMHPLILQVNVYQSLMNDYLIYAVTESDIWYTGMMYHEAEEVDGHWVSAYSVSRDLGVLKQVFRSQIHNVNE